MIYSVRGKLIHKDADFVVVESGGIGYRCFVTGNTLSNLPSINQEVMLLTHLHIKDDSAVLLGFIEESELESFKLLRTVNGVGIKSAISILSVLTPQKLALAIVGGDLKSITQAQGIGKKVGERIILELKDKMKNADVAQGISQINNSISGGNSSNISEAIDALMVLGYDKSDAMSAISQLDSTLPTQELIRQSLKKIAANI